MSDPASHFCRLAVERGHVSTETVQACLVKAKQSGESLPRLIAGEAGLGPDAARELYSEACKLAVGPPEDATLDCSLDREENLIGQAPLPGSSSPVPAASASSSSALDALAASGFGRVPTLAPVQPTPESTLVQAGSMTDLAEVLRPGGVLGGIRLEAELGRGSMGVVWRGQHLRLQRPVALKLLNPALMRNPTMRARFDAEAIGVAKLQHPNIVRIYDTSGPNEPFAYFVMEYVQGQALDSALRSRRYGAEESTKLIALVARAAHYAHTHGVVHRDLKPGNILLDTNGVPYLTDFGIAKHSDGQALTRIGDVLGTPAYMSPEQAEGQGALVDARADVYALGAVLYRMLTGQPPFVASSSYEILNKLVRDPVVPPSSLAAVPAGIEVAVLRALAKKREHRFPSALALAEALEHELAAGSRPTPGPVPAVAPVAPVPIPTPSPKPPVRRRASGRGAAVTPSTRVRSASGGASPWVYVLGAGLFVALGLVGGLGFVVYNQSRESERLAQEQQAAEEKAKLEADNAQLDQAWDLRKSDPEQALRVAREVAVRRPEAFKANALLGLLLSTEGAEVQDKLKHLDLAIGSQQGDLELLSMRARTLIALDRMEDADTALTLIGSLGDEGRHAVLRLRGELALAEGAKQGAALQFEQALKEDPSDAELFVQTLSLLIELRRYDSARKQALAFESAHPDDARAHAWAARANQRLGNNDVARKHVEQALQLDPDQELAKRVLKDLPRRSTKPPARNPEAGHGDSQHDATHAALQAGLNALRRNNQEAAKQALQAAMREQKLTCVKAIFQRAQLALALGALQIADHDLTLKAMSTATRDERIRAMELHATVKARMGDNDAALRLYNRAVGLDPSNHNLVHERGHHHERVGDLKQALADLKAALSLSPDDGHYLVVYGSLLRKADDPEGAREVFKRALSDVARGSLRPGDEARAKQNLKELGGS